jgi:hypothetical protein
VKAHPRLAPLSPTSSFVEHLKGKSRRRRQDMAGLAEAEAARRPRRNDLLPRLELAHVPLDMLKMPASEVRKLQPAHVRQGRQCDCRARLLRADPDWKGQSCP